MNANDPRSTTLSPPLLEVVAELGYASFTPIQAECIPLLLAGKDVIGQSKTGSGKTAAFALPLLERVDPAQRRIQAVVLCPTRELATQVAREIRKLARRLAGLQVLVVAGGQPARPQLDALARGVHVVVGTPGRVVDFLERDALDLRGVGFAVLDEADRMLEMGFSESMARVMRALPTARQTALFSATFPPAIATVSRTFQRDPVRVTIDDASPTAPDVRQLVHRVDSAGKADALARILRAHPHESAIVFCNLKATVVELERSLRTAGAGVAGLQGDLEQNDRDRVLAKFRNHSTRVLVATDVAARGLDIEHLDLVVNYDLPPQVELYVHRIGRTGRTGRSGLAVSLATPREDSLLRAIEHQTGVRFEPVAFDAAPPAGADDGLRDAPMVTLYVSGGRKDKVRPGDILGALTGEAGGLDAKDVGKIEIHDHFAYVAIARPVARRALDSLAAGRIKGRKFRVGYVD